MELRTKSAPVTVSGASKIMSFGIANNEKMFRILSDNLYQDKQGSIVREISCNARDGHVMAGKEDVPFVIHLPDAMEPWLSIRDFGVGLSPEAVETVFCMYGESTKDQSNVAVGAFGLGAKTPFAYTDQFNVISNYEGVQYHYNAAIINGIPQIILMMETPTDEGNGVEVKIGVKPGDFRTFEEAVRSQLRFLPVKPIIENYHNGDEFQFEDFGEVAFESSNARLMSESTRSYNSSVYIVQGPVGYPLDVNIIRPHLSSTQHEFLKSLSDYNVHLLFDIGEIGVTASREGVEYNEFTIANIAAKISNVRDEVVAWVQQQIKEIPNDYERVKFLNSNEIFHDFIKSDTLKLGHAKRSSNGTYYFTITDFPEFNINYTTKDINDKDVLRTRSAVSITEYTATGNSGFAGTRSTDAKGTIYPTNQNPIRVILRKINTRAPIARMRSYFLSNSLTRMYSVVVDDAVPINAALIKELSAYLGGFSDIITEDMLPELDKVAYDRSSAVSRDYSRPTAYRATNVTTNGVDSVANWDRVYDKLALGELKDSDDNDVTEALYITVDRQRTAYSLLKAIYIRLVKSNIKMPPLFAIRTGDEDKLAKSGITWIKFDDFVAAKQQEIQSDHSIKRLAVAMGVLELTRRRVSPAVTAIAPRLNARSTIRRVAMLKSHATKIVEEGKSINQHMLSIANHDVSENPVIKIMRERTKDMYSKVPLLDSLGSNGLAASNPSEIDHIVSYVNHFDR